MEAHQRHNEYYVSLGRRLKRKSEDFRKTVNLNSTLKQSPIQDSGNLILSMMTVFGYSFKKLTQFLDKRAYKMKLIHPNKILARGVNKKVIEVLQKKEG